MPTVKPDTVYEKGRWSKKLANVIYMLGNVGVGVAEPKAKLEVDGTVKATKFEGDGSALTGISTETVTLLDEDDMASDSATAVPTQQSVKAYVDNNTGGGLTLHCRGSWNGAGANGSKTVSGGRGVTTFTVTKVTTGSYTITMAEAHPEGTNYTPNLQGYRDVSGYLSGTAAQVRVNSATEFEVRTEGTGGLANFEFVSVEVYS